MTPAVDSEAQNGSKQAVCLGVSAQVWNGLVHLLVGPLSGQKWTETLFYLSAKVS